MQRENEEDKKESVIRRMGKQKEKLNEKCRGAEKALGRKEKDSKEKKKKRNFQKSWWG